MVCSVLPGPKELLASAAAAAHPSPPSSPPSFLEPFFANRTCPSSLQFEADRRAFIITINSFGTELSKEDRAKLFPHCGKLYPEGLAQLARADDYEQVKAVADYYPVRCLSSPQAFLDGWRVGG